jgi:hypothetical protein
MYHKEFGYRLSILVKAFTMVGVIVEHGHHPLTSAVVLHNCLQEYDKGLRIQFVMDLGASFTLVMHSF